MAGFTAIIEDRTWEDYSIGRDTVRAHLSALDLVTQDLLIDHASELETFHWFVRAHLENASGAITR